MHNTIRSSSMLKLFRRSTSSIKPFLPLLLALSILNAGGAAKADVRVAHSALVSENASFFTPAVLDGRVEAIAIEGDTVYLGGTFTQIQEPLDGEVIDQAYLFAYSKSTGAIMRDFDPQLNNAVRALHTTGDGTGVFVGGNFTILNGETNRKGLIKMDNFGDRVFGFSARPNRRVYAMDRSGGTLYIGGNFTSISGQSRQYLAAVDTATGALLSNIDLDFDGAISSDEVNGVQSVDVIEVSSDDDYMIVAGNFLSINDQSRTRLALLELGEQATVSTWNTNIYDDLCPADKFPQYINGLDIAPDDSYFVVGTFGGHRVGDPACDTVVRFDPENRDDSDAEPTWVNWTGGDSVYEVAASEHAIYVGGHYRWLNNGPTSKGDRAGPGAIERRGLAALDPRNGLPIVDWRADRNPRGVGVFALEVQPEGLYIGDDTDFLNNFEHPKFKFLALTDNVIQRPEVVSLPATTFNINGNELEIIPFDGNTFGSSLTVSTSGWNDARGAMFLDGKLFHADDDGDMWMSTLFEDNTFGNRVQVDLLGLTDDEWELDELGGMFFDHQQSRVYYTIDGESRLYYRAFTPDGPIFGDFEYEAEDQGDILWSDVRGMDVIDGHLYFGRGDGRLYRSDINGSSPVSGTTLAVSGPGIDENDWDNRFLTFASEGAMPPPLAGAQFEFEAVGSSENRSFRTFEFPVVEGEPVNVRLTWDDPSAQLNVFLRDENGVLVDADNNPSGSANKWLFAPAGSGGLYTVAVKILEGGTAYTVSINPFDEQPPAGAMFIGSGSETSGQWQVFDFDVAAGDLVEAEVSWDNPDATLRVFLRDETNSQVDRDTDESGSPENVSAIAPTAGVWTVGVRITGGTVAYDVAVNITSGVGDP